jgi:hypothetical protein
MAIPLQCLHWAFPGNEFSTWDSSTFVICWLTLLTWTLNCTALTRSTEHWSVESYNLRVDLQKTLHASSLVLLCDVTTHAYAAILCNGGCTCRVSWHLLCCLLVFPSNGWCLQSHLIAMGLYATIPWFVILSHRVRRELRNQSPYFEQTLYVASVMEERPPPVVVTTVKARDPENSSVSYSMLSLLDSRSQGEIPSKEWGFNWNLVS